MYEFTARVQATKSGKLLVKQFEQKNSSEETNSLFANLGYSSQKNFNEYWGKVYQLKSAFQTKFPELANLSNAKEILETAAQKAATTNEFSKKSKFPQSLCWATFIAELGACSIVVCNEAGLDRCDCSWELCMETCTLAAISYSGLCLLLAD